MGWQDSSRTSRKTDPRVPSLFWRFFGVASRWSIRGLSTCCHGEEPRVVGWRFINARRAIHPDPNRGGARGKADVLYVADAFQVMAKGNALLEEASKSPEQTAIASD
jgi:hypothetical protein